MNELKTNVDKVHTTKLGVERIKKNLSLDATDVVTWCKEQIENSSEITRHGKNWYVQVNNVVITVNAHSYTIITAHKNKRKNNDKDKRRMYLLYVEIRWKNHPLILEGERYELGTMDRLLPSK